MTKRELISQIKDQLRQSNADSRLSNRFIWSLIDKHLRWLIKRENNKFHLYDMHEIFQTYKCVEVIEAPTIDDCCGVKSKCKVWRTANKLPKIYESDAGLLIKSVFSIDGSVDFMQIEINEYMRKLENPTTRKYDKGKYYYYNNGYLYLPQQEVRMIMVKAYFEDELLNNCESNCVINCTPKLDEIVRIPGFILGELMSFVVKDILGILQIQPDEQIDKNENRKN